MTDSLKLRMPAACAQQTLTSSARWTRRAAGCIAAAAMALGLAACGGGDDDVPPPKKELGYPDVTDTTHATQKVSDTIATFFSAKSLHKAAPMVAVFAPAPETVLYIDAGLGFSWPSQQALLDVWSGASFANGPATALSYPTRIVGDEHSALVEFVDTPELLGQEFRFLASVTFNDKGQIIRWVDYWDGRSSKTKIRIGQFGPYPTDFHDNVVNASAKIKSVSQALQLALAAGNAAAVAQMFTADSVYEDMALHTRLLGAVQIQRYLERGIGQLPYGAGATIAHVVGSDQGGGYEWLASSSASPLVRGNTAIELDSDSKITRFTTVYDSAQFTDAKYAALVSLASELIPAP